LFNELVSLSARTIANFTKIFIYANQILIFHFHLLRPAILCLFRAGILKLRAIPGTKRNKYKFITNNRTPASPTILPVAFSSNVNEENNLAREENSNLRLFRVRRNFQFYAFSNGFAKIWCAIVIPRKALCAW